MITFYLKYFPGSIYKNSIWFALSDFFSAIISGTLLKKTNINRALQVSFGVSAFGAITYLLYFEYLFFVPFFIIMSRMGNSMAFNTIYVSNNKLFPTKLIATSYGIVSLVSHLTAIGAPLLAESTNPIPFLIFLINACVGAAMSFFLKELYGKECRSWNFILNIF